MASETPEVDPDDIDDTQWAWAAMSPELTDREKALRNAFVDEYLIDYDETAAAQRVGFQVGFAKDYAVRFMNESYVRQRIEFVKHSKVDTIKMEQFDKETVRAVLRKEMHNNFGTAAARVQAAAKMAAILGMDKPVETKHDHTHKGGVLMVPAIANLNDWEALATESQQKLVSDARH